jgi:hypothetical protein
VQSEVAVRGIFFLGVSAVVLFAALTWRAAQVSAKDSRDFYSFNDVPAVHNIQHPAPDNDPHKCKSDEYVGNDYTGYWCVPNQEYVCADNTRILLHDEQNPPLWWCHRVQP